jgi:hypothetical protein
LTVHAPLNVGARPDTATFSHCSRVVELTRPPSREPVAGSGQRDFRGEKEAA